MTLDNIVNNDEKRENKKGKFRQYATKTIGSLAMAAALGLGACEQPTQPLMDEEPEDKVEIGILNHSGGPIQVYDGNSPIETKNGNEFISENRLDYIAVPEQDGSNIEGLKVLTEDKMYGMGTVDTDGDPIITAFPEYSVRNPEAIPGEEGMAYIRVINNYSVGIEAEQGSTSLRSRDGRGITNPGSTGIYKLPLGVDIGEKREISDLKFTAVNKGFSPGNMEYEPGQEYSFILKADGEVEYWKEREMN